MVLNTQAEFKWRHSQPYWSLLKILPNLTFKPVANVLEFLIFGTILLLEIALDQKS